MNRRLGVILATMLLIAGVIFAQQPVMQSSSSPSVSPRFEAVDVFVDPLGKPLAAYQVEFVAGPTVTLVGIEGGEHLAYKNPPYYDPAALAGNRVILAALSTAEELPAHRARVARLHVRVTGEVSPVMSAKLIVAAGTDEQTIHARVEVVQGE